LAAVEAKARKLGCCKLTLEVRRDNTCARGLYRKVGFDQVTVEGRGVPVEFWQKPLPLSRLPPRGRRLGRRPVSLSVLTAKIGARLDSRPFSTLC
ncbi:MAG: GNAT family N-acetyltransferase, partial [Candidatus Binataceae bacterium]